MLYVQILLLHNVLFFDVVWQYRYSYEEIKNCLQQRLRRILNLPKYNSASEMFVNLNIPSFDELLRKFVYSFKSRI